MGFTCSSKTARNMIKLAGKDYDKLINRVLEFQRLVVTFNLPEVTEEMLTILLEKLMDSPYLYFGRNKLKHKFVLNGKSFLKSTNIVFLSVHAHLCSRFSRGIGPSFHVILTQCLSIIITRFSSKQEHSNKEITTKFGSNFIIR